MTISREPSSAIHREAIQTTNSVGSITRAVKPAFSLEKAGFLREAIANILQAGESHDFSYRKAIDLTLTQLRQQDEQTFRGIANLISGSKQALIEAPENEGKETGWHLKLSRFLLAAYFTEQWWPHRPSSSAPVFDHLREEPRSCYKVRLHDLYKESLTGSQFPSPTEHIDAGLRTARFINREFLSLVTPVFLKYLRENGREKLAAEDKPTILAIGKSTIPIIAKLASGDIETARRFVSSGGNPTSKQTFEIPQNPDAYYILEKSLSDGKTEWSIQQKEDCLDKLQPSNGIGIGCPAFIARTPEGTPITTALANETFETWSELIQNIPFDDKWASLRLWDLPKLNW